MESSILSFSFIVNPNNLTLFFFPTALRIEGFNIKCINFIANS